MAKWFRGRPNQPPPHGSVLSLWDLKRPVREQASHLSDAVEPAGHYPPLFEIHTAHNTLLGIDRPSGTLLHGLPDPARGRVFACLPPDRPDTCFLVAETGAPMLLAGDVEHDPVVSLRAVRHDDGSYAFAHPITGLHLCAELLPDGHGRVAVNREQVNVWERFTLLPTGLNAAAVRALGRVLATLPARRSAPAALDAIVAAAPGAGAALRPVLRLLRMDEADWLGRALRRDRDACAAFAALYPDDVWAAQALPALAADARNAILNGSGFVRQVGTSLDILAPFDTAGRHRSFPQLCTVFARRDRAPARTVCLLATARNEGIYLLEWLAYHRLLGVEAFFLYSNDNDDGSDELLRALAAAGVLNWTSNSTAPGVSPQFKAYAHALQMLPEVLDFRWAGIIDLDEFVVLNAGLYPSLPAFLAVRDAEETDGVMLNWVAFGSNGHARRSPEPVVARFLSRDEAVNPHVKTFLRPHRFVHAMPHHPYADRTVRPAFRTASGAPHPAEPFSPHPEDGHAFIAHYYAKSAEEYILRRSGRRADLPGGAEIAAAHFSHAVASGFLDQHRRGGVSDDRAARHLPELQAEMARLRALPGVDEAMRRVEQLYAARLASIVQGMAEDARFTVAGTPEHWFADVLASGPPAG